MTDDLNEDPTSTWGASEDYKARWNEKYGVSAPSRNASKAEWVEWAQNDVHGSAALSAEDADALTRDQLQEQFGGEVSGLVSAPSAPNDSTAGQGAGTSPEGNVATDPTVGQQGGTGSSGTR